MAESNRLITLASQLHYVYGILISLGTLPFAIYLIRNREVPVFFGIRAFGDGFIERLGGLDALVYSSGASIVAALLNLLPAFWLARGEKLGGIIALVLFPVNMFFTLGYNAPAPILLGLANVILVIGGWRSLH